MSIDLNPLKAVFAKNRTEELGYDVWEQFVIPPFYDRLDLETAKKPRVIIGGRGCGKTMLLRYLSHQTAFSRKRPTIPDSALRHIGLYWRADTQFSRIMEGRGVPEENWISAFNHLTSLLVGIEIIRSLESIAASSCSILKPDDLAKLRFDRLKPFDDKFACNLTELGVDFERRVWELESWVANVKKKAEPVFLPGPRFLLALITEIKTQLPQLADAVYFVYIDEYENLCLYQQKVINTYLKHSEVPLIVSLAMKRNAFKTTATLGDESIVNIADYRTHDLEEYLLDDEFPVLAAEVLFLNLALANIQPIPVKADELRDLAALPKRRTASYREEVLSQIRTIFPSVPHERLATIVFEESALLRILTKKISSALEQRGSTVDPLLFIRPALPAASITASALVCRSSLTPEEVLSDLDQLEKEEPNRFTGKTAWVHNNFIGCLLAIYEPYSKTCPFYAGFDTFCLLARGNLRHFLELCHKSLNQLGGSNPTPKLCVPPEEQAQAARQTSAAFLDEIRAFGRQGNRLHTFVLRLGSLFSIAHRRPAQSEPEQSHFSITRGHASVTDSDVDFLREAEKWSVLFEEKATKVRDPFQPITFEYVLNPIYAPYFNITYRKKHKLELSSDEFAVLVHGSYDEATALLKRYSKKWEVELVDVNPTLFSHLQEEHAK